MESSENDDTPAGLSRRQVLLGMAAATAAGAIKGLGAAPMPATTRAAESELIVHEWGVAIRHATASGSVLAPPAELISGLPSFVVVKQQTKTLQPQGWDKPVIWFHGSVPDGMKVRVTVMANQGFATAAFPPAELLTRKFSQIDKRAMMMSLITESAGFNWEGTLTRAAAGTLPQVAADHWWQTARAAGGFYFNTKGETERFIFYEATAFQEPPVTAKVSADAILIRNDFEMASGEVIVVLNSASGHYMRVIEAVGPKAEVKLSRSEVMREACSEEKLLAACAAQWKSFGMTGPESEAIVAVWRADLLKPQRFLMISRMPTKLYEAMFPLTIEPAPKEVIRVGMLFDALEGQLEATTWLPGLAPSLTKAASDLASNNWKEREEAMHQLAGAGERARGILEKLAGSDDPEVGARATELLKEMTPPVETLTREGTDSKTGVMIQAIK